MTPRKLLAPAAIAGIVLVVAWWLGRSPPPSDDPRDVSWSPLPRRVTAEVLNGGGLQGAARDAALRLREAGVDVVYFGNAPAALRDSLRTDHRILLRRGDSLGAGRVTEVLGTTTVSDEPDPDRLVDLTIVLARDSGSR